DSSRAGRSTIESTDVVVVVPNTSTRLAGNRLVDPVARSRNGSADPGPMRDETRANLLAGRALFSPIPVTPLRDLTATRSAMAPAESGDSHRNARTIAHPSRRVHKASSGCPRNASPRVMPDSAAPFLPT